MSFTSVTLRDLMKWEHLIMGTDIVPKQRVSSILAGKHTSMMRGRGLDFEEVRNYVPGDDIRNIDWKVTARTKKTHTKVFNEEKERPALVIVDQTSFLNFGSSQYLKSVIAAQAAAMAAFRTVKKGDRCGGLVFNDNSSDWFAPRRSRQAIMQLLKAVSNKNQILSEVKQTQSNALQLHNALKRVANYVTHDFIISIISDFSHCEDNTFKIIKQMAQHNDIICVHIEDEIDHITHLQNIVITNGGKQLFWKKQKQKTINLENETELDFKNKLKELNRKYLVPVLYLNTAQALEEQIKNIFKQRR